MAGLFDFLSQNPAITQGLLAGAFGAMAGRGSRLQAWGQGGLAGLQGYANAMNQQSQEQDRALAAKRVALQDQMLQMQLEQAQRAQQGQKATQDYLSRALSPVAPIDANAVSGIAGPRPKALAPVGTTPGFNTGAALQAGVPVEMLPQIQKMLSAGQPDYKVVGNDLVQVGPQGAKSVFTSQKPEDINSLIIRDPVTGRPMVNQLALDAKRQIAQSGATNIKIDNKLGEGLATQVGPMVKASYDAASGAIQQITTADSLIKAVESNKIMTGPGATLRLRGAQIGQALGVGGADTAETIANTRSAIQGLAQSTIAARAALKGQGQVSDFEGRLLERAASGNIDDMTANEIKQIAIVNKRLAEKQIQNHKAFVEKLKAKEATSSVADMFSLPVDQAPIKRYNPATGKIE